MKWSVGSVTDIVGELGKETRDVVSNVALLVGSVVTRVDNGRVRVLSVVTGCEFGTSVEDGTLLVCESNTWVVDEVEVLSIPEVSVSNEVNEELLGVEAVTSDTVDRVEMSVVEVIVAFLVGVIMVVKKVLVPDVEVEGGSVAVVNVLVVTGVGVESTVVSREWGKVGAEGTLPVWLVLVLAERDEEDADVTGRLVANGLELFPVPEGVAVLLGVVRVEVVTGVVSKFWGLEKEGMSVVWAVDMVEPSWVAGMSVVTSGTVLLAEEVTRTVTGVVETSTVGEFTVSLTPEVLGRVEILSVE